MPFWIYIIQNDVSGGIYIGQTSNIEKRLATHNNKEFGKRKYTTKQPGLWRLIYSEELKTRSEAMRREEFLKSGMGRIWIKNNVTNRRFSR